MKMNKTTYSLALLTFAVGATAIQAAPIDPKIIVSGGGDATSVTAPVFTFMSDVAGGGVFSFTNDTSSDFASLDLFVKLPQGSPLTVPPIRLTGANLPLQTSQLAIWRFII